METAEAFVYFVCVCVLCCPRCPPPLAPSSVVDHEAREYKGRCFINSPNDEGNDKLAFLSNNAELFEMLKHLQGLGG